MTAITSPVMEIVATGGTPDLTGSDGVIVTSAHAVRGSLGGRPAYCVGQRTAEAVRAAGGLVRYQAPDADQLLRWLAGRDDVGAVIYMRGSHIATDLCGPLNTAGIPCSEVQTYRQDQLSLSASAIRMLEGEDAAILPLFSARSARLVGHAIAQQGPGLHVITISDAVANAWRDITGGTSEVSAMPTGDAMVDKIVAALRC
ncbi:uroporphyrinogen-III synthase [Aliiroseovarius sp. 2305UL8-7]|uniref:uroporphyrinogen-III synthase n=1 Tax=Aliiroseovarius conchicola TaxID=3121637 RepID=UPI0035277DBF